jgi:hypothetical protein
LGVTTHLLPTDRLASDTIPDPIITRLTVLSLQPLFLEFGGFRFDFVVEELDQFGLGVWGRILDVVISQNAQKLRHSEHRRIEIGTQIPPECYYL